MPRPRNLDPNVAWATEIPSSLAAKVELALYDPVRQNIQYGARRKLLVALLSDWLARTQQGGFLAEQLTALKAAMMDFDDTLQSERDALVITSKVLHHLGARDFAIEFDRCFGIQ